MMNRTNYRTRLMLAIFVTAAIGLFISGFVSLSSTEDLLIERIMLRITTTGNIMANEIAENLNESHPEDIRELLAVLVSQPRVNFASVLATDQTVLFSSRREWEGSHSPVKDDINISESYGRSDDSFVRSFPVFRGEVLIGYLQTGFSVTYLEGDLRKLMLILVAESIGVILLLLIVAWILSGRLLQPLEMLRQNAQRVASGDFSVRQPISSDDVIGKLSAEFNIMTEKLKAYTENLQEKVDEATAELEISNRELLKRTEELEQANIHLQKLDKARAEFLSFASHELKNPLTGIIGFSRILEKGRADEEKKLYYISLIRSEGERMTALVDDFLDISRMESGTFALHREPNDLRTLIQDVLAFTSRPETVSIVSELQDTLPIIDVDPDRLKQVLVNLLSNAIKYSPQGGTVTLKVRQEEDFLVISVTDEGPGIQEKDRTRIFEKNYRGSDNLTQRLPGSGIGLAITKAIVEAHGGSIRVEPGPGKGSIFTVTVPLIIPDR